MIITVQINGHRDVATLTPVHNKKNPNVTDVRVHTEQGDPDMIAADDMATVATQLNERLNGPMATHRTRRIIFNLINAVSEADPY